MLPPADDRFHVIAGISPFVCELWFKKPASYRWRSFYDLAQKEKLGTGRYRPLFAMRMMNQEIRRIQIYAKMNLWWLQGLQVPVDCPIQSRTQKHCAVNCSWRCCNDQQMLRWWCNWGRGLVGSGIFKSGDPKRVSAIVKARNPTTKSSNFSPTS